MDPFFAGMPPATALVLAALSRELYDTRQMRRQLLSDTRCTCADAVLQAITDGRLPEHPGWEAWLSLQLLERHERHLQTRLDWRCRHPAAEAEPDGFDDSAFITKGQIGFLAWSRHDGRMVSAGAPVKALQHSAA